jgi:biopolymer transport protein TolQ
MNRTVDAAGLAAAEAAQLSFWHLFIQADIVVKAVMIGLLIASVLVWAVIFEKAVMLRRVRRAAAQFEDQFWSGGSLDELYDRIGASPQHPMAAVFAAAMREFRRSAASLTGGSDAIRLGARERIERAMSVTIGREMTRLEQWMTYLATVGSAAPFVGLFGTVWGIMNSFTAIAAMRNTNLAVVAPGIAEALFATAIGLVAAIPAVVAYNKIAAELGRFAARLEGFATEFAALLSRQAEGAPAARAAAE